MGVSYYPEVLEPSLGVTHFFNFFGDLTIFFIWIDNTSNRNNDSQSGKNKTFYTTSRSSHQEVIQKKTPAQVSFYDFFKVFNNTAFIKHV